MLNVGVTWLTFCVMAVDVLPLKLLSPPYTAVMEWLPAVSDAVVIVAMPLALSVPVPMIVTLSLNVTLLVGVPWVDVTVAVNVTD